MKEEVHIEYAEENPIVRWVFEDVHERHGIVAKSMHQNCLKLTLDVVKEYHEDSKLLI